MTDATDLTSRRGGRALALGSVALAAAVGVVPPLAGPAAAAENLVANGSFENPDVAAGTYQIFESIPGWWFGPRSGATTSGFEIQDNYGGFRPAADGGKQFLELDADGSTRIQQEVGTKAGRKYRLTFLSSPRPGTDAKDNAFTASAGSAVLPVPAHATTGSSTVWTTRTLDFVAAGDRTLLRFVDDGPSNSYGAFIDRVAVELVG